VAGGQASAASAELVGLSLVSDPANMNATQLRWRSGSILCEVDRTSWAVGWEGETPLLARALACRAGLRTRSVTRIVDRRSNGDEAPMLVGADAYDAQPIGPWRHSAPYKGGAERPLARSSLRLLKESEPGGMITTDEVGVCLQAGERSRLGADADT
jgi:hypothetical protein